MSKHSNIYIKKKIIQTYSNELKKILKLMLFTVKSPQLQ